MIFVNCAVEENKPIRAVLETGADVNGISHKYISELGITYHSESNSIVTPDASYFTLGNVNLHIDFNDDKKHKSISGEFIVLGPEWPDHYPDLVLGNPWLQKNNATIDMYNSLLTIDDNFAILFKEVPMQYPKQ